MVSKIKSYFKNIYDIFKKSTEKFPITIFTIFIITALVAISLGNNIFKGNTILNITTFGFFFSITTFLIETFEQKSIKKKLIFYTSAIIVSTIFTYALNIKNSIFMIKLIVCYCISIILLAIYFNYKKSNKTFEEYLTRIFINILKSSIVYGVLAIGSLIILSVFIFLILDNNSYLLVLRVEILLLGIYYIPSIIYSFYNVNNEIGKFSKGLIKYILNSLIIIAFAIIYMYIAKIIILRVIPSNQIFRILAILFILGCPIWTMTSSFKDEDLINKINKYLPIMFIPFIILQIYSIGMRIANNGVTGPRYLCVMLIVFEIAYIIIYLKSKEKIGNVLTVAIVITIISTVVPYINMFKVSELSQYNNLKIYKEKTTYTEKEKDKIYGAYIYLKDKEYINNMLTEKDIETILTFGNIKYEIITKYIYAYKDIDDINIQGYNRLYIVNANNYTEKDLEKAFNNLKFETESGKNIYFDLTNIFKNYINNRNDIDDYFEDNYEFDIDENKKIIIKNFSIDYNEVNKKVKSYSISAYVLQK